MILKEQSVIDPDQNAESHEVTRILHAVQRGEQSPSDELIPFVYSELRRLAAFKMSHERPDHTLQPTALVHEAYLRIFQGSIKNWECRRHFFATAAEAMRRILIENARRKETRKRGRDYIRSGLDPDEIDVGAPSMDLIDVDQALSDLAETDRESAELVKLRYFAGLTFEQIGELMGFSTRTAKNRWVYARTWLYRRLKEMR